MLTYHFIGAFIAFTMMFFSEPHWAKMGVLDSVYNTLLMVLIAACWPVFLFINFFSLIRRELN